MKKRVWLSLLMMSMGDETAATNEIVRIRFSDCIATRHLTRMVRSISMSFGDSHARRRASAAPGSTLWLTDRLACIIEATANIRTASKDKGHIRR